MAVFLPADPGFSHHDRFLGEWSERRESFGRMALTLGPNPLESLPVKILALMLGVYCWHMGRQQLLSRQSAVRAGDRMEPGGADRPRREPAGHLKFRPPVL